MPQRQYCKVGIICLQGDMQISLQVLRDELAVNEERFSRQLQQWRKVAEAQRRCSHPATLCAHALCIHKAYRAAVSPIQRVRGAGPQFSCLESRAASCMDWPDQPCMWVSSRVQEAQSVTRNAERDMAAAISTLGKAVLVNEERAGEALRSAGLFACHASLLHL